MLPLLMLFWIVLNGRAQADVLITGVCVCALVLTFMYFFGAWSFKREITIYRLIPGGLMYAVYLAGQIVLANISVIKLIYTKREQPCIRTFATSLKTKAARAVLANSITLTPGTVTVQLTDNVLTVHCLTREMAEGLTCSGFEKRLLRLEDKANGRSI